MKEFGGNTRLDYHATLAKMYQSGPITDYRQNPMQQAVSKSNWFSMGRVVNLLCQWFKRGIWLDVRAHKPNTLLQAYELAMIF